MDYSKKFIITQNSTTANTLISNGFHLVSNVCGTYTFINQPPENFSFSSVDTTQLHFTNNLHI